MGEIGIVFWQAPRDASEGYRGASSQWPTAYVRADEILRLVDTILTTSKVEAPIRLQGKKELLKQIVARSNGKQDPELRFFDGTGFEARGRLGAR